MTVMSLKAKNIEADCIEAKDEEDNNLRKDEFMRTYL